MNELMTQIYQYSFAVDDVLLYLDTHPDDQDALAYYQCMRDARETAVAAYECQFGPLTKDGVKDSADYWTWVNGPWPWEGGGSTCGTMRRGCNTR
ncbi:spore coat protein CotJB [Qiania dongpingensis]|uniref:Spore coat protein CotJB n=1 Tax=Qiania dongpingensis TaxID=2763669 RepID=A0A7G9G2R3_9FIRM|nr:spore coat protein CotJB [Qiania dongpingensis]QNM05095.1 spore coat protein CotJB [Qiania dongpingensis]